MPNEQSQTTIEPPFDFETYDRCIAEGLREYLEGGAANPYAKGTNEHDWWQEGYDR